MNAMRINLAVVLLALVGAGMGQAQPIAPPGMPAAPPPSAMLTAPSAALVDGALVSPAANNWLNSSNCYCCSPVGGNGPISAELFTYNGPTLAAGGGTVSQGLTAGWMTEIGGRSLFFNNAGNRAWVAIIGFIYQYNSGSTTGAPIPLFNFAVAPRNLHRWSMSAGGGREWFLFGADADGASGLNLRFGVDLGGRWGTSHINLNRTDIVGPPEALYVRRQDVFRSFYMAGHLDLEVPMGGWVWFAGFRSEFAFNWWSDLLPGSDNRLNDVNLLLSTGLRY